MILFSIIAVLIIVILIVIMFNIDDEPRKIAIYSGSFNPIHIGHKVVIDYLSNNYDWTYLIVTPQNPLKEDIEVSFEERIRNVTKALQKNEYFNVTPSSIEKDMRPPYYTINTLRKLKEKQPNNQFKLAIGGDCLVDIKKWNSYQEILTNFGVIVFPRGDLTFNILNDIKRDLLMENPLYQIDIINQKTPDISSSDIRKAKKNGENVKYLIM
jgi:nicotinate-nucleotide adenylyltransferase